MKYYRFSKRFFLIRAFETLLLAFGAVVLPPFIVMSITAFLAMCIKDFSADQLPRFVIVFLLIACLSGTIFLFIKFFIQKQGVYLCENSVHFVSLNYNFKFVNYSNIADIEYVGSFYKDRDARYGKFASFTANYLGGKTGDCVKITFYNGNRRRCCFLSVEDNDELIKEIKQRTEKNICV